MEVIEERVKIKGVEISKSELLDIRDFLKLSPNGTYTLNTKENKEVVFKTPNGTDSEGNTKFHSITKKVQVATLVRKSKGMQKALNGRLLIAVNESLIVADESLVDAFSRY